MTHEVVDRVFILGAGRAGLSLARALLASGEGEVHVHGRHPIPGLPQLSVGALPPAIARATAVLVTVRDAQLDDALGELARAPLAAGAVVLHASGSIEPSGLEALRAHGHPAGTFHPLVSLADPAHGVELLRGAWIGLDGDPLAIAAGRRLATRIGAHALTIPAGAKPRYHAAAVFAANFPTVLAALAESLLEEIGIPAEAARPAVRRLMASALENLATRPATTALTGPVARGDAGSVARHLEALRAEPATLDAYVALSRLALSLAAQDPAYDRARRLTIERLLAEALDGAR